MKVTVCELSDQEADLVDDWSGLQRHIEEEGSDLVLLPEMPFCEWIAHEREVSGAAKILSVARHDKWMAEIERLGVQRVIYSRPVIEGHKFLNTAFIFEKGIGHRKIHSKSRFPEEPDFWEESWFDRDDPVTFELVESGGIKIGVLLCTEMWFPELAREYGKQDMDILVCPRATEWASTDKWIRCGQTLSVISGAYCLSSNRSGFGDKGFHWGGSGWVAEPVTGEVMAVTSVKQKFITRGIDISKSRAAKRLYPQYVKSGSASGKGMT